MAFIQDILEFGSTVLIHLFGTVLYRYNSNLFIVTPGQTAKLTRL